MHERTRLATVCTAALAAALLAACQAPSAGGAGPTARAELAPTAGNAAAGWVAFEQRGPVVRVTAEVRGLRPNAEHGFHVHERGDCSAPDASSAGGHFDPAGAPHGHPGQSRRHAGDLPNLRADASGVARLSVDSDQLTVDGGARSVVGRGVVVHRDADDYASQPAGNSGPRLACGAVAARR